MDSLNFQLWQKVNFDGYVTDLKSILAGGTRPVDQETKLGYTPGSLAGGYWLFVLSPQETIKNGEFEYRGYTHLEDGIAKGHAENVHKELEKRYQSNAIDRETWKNMLDRTVIQLNRGGGDRICKLIFNRDAVGYEPGKGVVQFYLKACKSFTAKAFVGPTQCLHSLGGEHVAVGPA